MWISGEPIQYIKSEKPEKVWIITKQNSILDSAYPLWLCQIYLLCKHEK